MSWKVGLSRSKAEEDKALQLCRERRKFVGQALNGQCALASAHITYVQSLRNVGAALKIFFNPKTAIDSTSSPSATPDPVALMVRSVSQSSFSPSSSHHSDMMGTLSPSSSPSALSIPENHARSQGSYSKRAEKVISPVTATAISSTPQKVTSSSQGKPEVLSQADASVHPKSPLWDYFGTSHPIDQQFSFQQGKGVKQWPEKADDRRKLKENSGIPDTEGDRDEDKDLFSSAEESQDSEDECDDPSTDTPLHGLGNLNTFDGEGLNRPSVSVPSTRASEVDSLKGGKGNSPDLSPLTLRETSCAADMVADLEKIPSENDDDGDKIQPKDFVSSVNDIESLFLKASECGEEVAKMLEANKFHLRPVFPEKEQKGVPLAFTFFRACFSCGEDHWRVQEESAQTAVKYLTWHRTNSLSSWDHMGFNSKDGAEEPTDNRFDNFCMVSGSHASTLDRLYAWERKLYDEVKASGIIRRKYDSTCKLLQQLESKDERRKIDKTRAVIKDLHTSIRVAIQRIDSISKSIEELRDKELQPQLEELIKGLSKMWAEMFDCHNLQLRILSAAYNSGNPKTHTQSVVRRQIAIYLENELSLFASSFAKWTAAQKFYLQSINSWLYKCVPNPQKSSKRKRKVQNPSIRDSGPPIYITCGVWLDILDSLPTKGVTDSIKFLSAEVSRSIPPHQEKGKNWRGKWMYLLSSDADTGSDAGISILKDDVDRFKLRLVELLSHLSNYAESSVNKYAELKKAVEEGKTNYEQRKDSQA